MPENHEDAKVIQEMGGTAYLAKRLELGQSAISNWCKRGVPKTSKKTLYLMFPKVAPESWKPVKVTKTKSARR